MYQERSLVSQPETTPVLKDQCGCPSPPKRVVRRFVRTKIPKFTVPLSESFFPPKPKKKRHRADAGRTNTHFYGTLNLQTGEEIAMLSDVMNSEVSARHLEMILDANPDVPILLFWDRAPWHRGKAINKILEKNPRLEIIRFPPACPELNPQEHVWKAVRRAVSHNHIEAKFPELAKRFLDKLNSNSFKSSFLRKYGYTELCTNFI